MGVELGFVGCELIKD